MLAEFRRKYWRKVIADPKFGIAVNLDFDDSNVVDRLEVKKGDFVPVIFTVKNPSNEPVVFDSISAEILFNDSKPIVEVDRLLNPRAGNLASMVSGALCASCGDELVGGSASDDPFPFASGSEMIIEKSSSNLVSGFSETTGIAGMNAPEGEKFVLEPHATAVVGAGKAAAKDFKFIDTGQTTLSPNATVYDGTEAVLFLTKNAIVVAH